MAKPVNTEDEMFTVRVPRGFRHIVRQKAFDEKKTVKEFLVELVAKHVEDERKQAA